MYVLIYLYISVSMYISISIYMYAVVSNGKQAQAFSLIRLPFAHHANRSLSFVHLFMKKKTEITHLQTD